MLAKSRHLSDASSSSAPLFLHNCLTRSGVRPIYIEPSIPNHDPDHHILSLIIGAVEWYLIRDVTLLVISIAALHTYTCTCT